MSKTVHVPVLFNEVLATFAPLEGKVIVDGTLGGGGHAAGMLRGGVSRLIGMDWDEAAIGRCAFLRDEFGDRVELHHAPYDRIADVLGSVEVDGVLLDLGFSSDQLDDAGRGLSYHHEGPLDMRLNSTLKKTAADYLNGSREEELADIFYYLGEEPKARVLARAIVGERKKAPLATTKDLLRVVEGVYPPRLGQKRAHPAARIFQALRVMVNDELAVLERALVKSALALKPGGRLAVITFQPLEDRAVKAAFKELCVDELDSVGRVVSRAPFKILKKIAATEGEVERNPRARSAILRVLERLA